MPESEIALRRPKRNIKMIIELHAHTAETSRCARVPAKEVVRRYKQAGYDALTVTDHYSFRTFADFPEDGFDRKIDRLLSGYRAAREEGEKIGLRVFFASECCFADHHNDYLVFGMDEDFIRHAPLISDLTLGEFLSIKPENVLVYQAHPFRNGMIVTNPEDLFGIEVYNGHFGHDSRNDIASAWADKYRLHMISGTDFHYDSHTPTGGIITDVDVRDEKMLADILKSDQYTLKRG